MKTKLYFCFLITLFSVSSIFSQIKLKVGANIGGQITSLRGIEYKTDTNFSLIPSVGINLEVALSPSVSIVTGINFERWKKKRYFTNFDPFAVPIGETSYKEGYDFYNIPFLVRYKFGGKKDFFVDGGAFVNYFNKGRPNSRYTSLYVQFEDYNFGTVLGVGKVFDLNDRFDVALQLRNELGFSDVNKYEWNVSGDIMTNTIRFIATFSFQL